MKKILLLLLSLASYATYAQTNTFGGIGLRVNDTTTYQTNAAAYHTAGYYDIYFNNQATNDHWDVWNGSDYDHIFEFNSATNATESVAGTAELATQAETDTGTDDERIVTPLKLNEWGKMKAVTIGADDATTSSTFENVTDLGFPVVNGGVYFFVFWIDYTTSATTNGSGWAITGPTASRISYEIRMTATTTTESVQNSLNAYDDADIVTTGNSGTTTQNMAQIRGFITVTADGTVNARFRTEAGGTITAKSGSVVFFTHLN